MTDRAPIRVLVVDDSPTLRMLIVRTLESVPDIRVVGTASDGAQAIEMTATLRPDLITMDVRMPNLDGVRATQEIMARFPTPVIVFSSTVPDDVQITFEAIHAGALEILPKPKSLTSEGFNAVRQKLIDTVRAMAEVKVVRRRNTGLIPVSTPSAPGRRFDLLAIGASTGGPQALEKIFAALPRDFPAPILVVQHITPGFLDGFARWLQGQTPLGVRIPKNDEPLLPGTVYLAPDGKHLRFGERFRAELSADAPRGMFRPSVDELFESVARHLGGHGAGLLLTGMGADGAEGLKALREAGALTMAQEDASCVVPGMPAAARSRGAVMHDVDLSRISEVLKSFFPART